MHTGEGVETEGQVRAALAAGLPLAIIGFLALRDGGFGLVERQEVAVALWWALALALAFGVVPRAEPPRGWRLAAGGFLAMAALALLSVAWGPSAERAVEEACRVLGYLAVLALAFTGLGPRSWRTAAASLFVVAVAITAYALVGRLVPEWAPASEAVPALDNGRLHAPLGYWNALGAWAAMTLAMALAWSADARERGVRMAALAAIPLAGLCLYLTYSRGAVLAAAIGIGLVIALTRNRRRAAIHILGGAAACAAVIAAAEATPAVASGAGEAGGGGVALVLIIAMLACAGLGHATRKLARRRGEVRPIGAGRPALAAALVAAVALVAVVWVAGSDGFGHGGDSAALTSSDPSARLTTAAGNRSAYWAEALDGFAARPLRGEGVGSFEYRWAETGSDDELVVDAHSLPLGVLAELGLLGLVALGALVAGLVAISAAGLAAARRNSQAVGLAAAATCFAASAAMDWTWQMAALAYLALAAVGTLAMAASRPLPRRVRVGPARWRWALVAAAVLAGAAQAPGLVSTALVQDAAEQRVLGDASEALELSDDAVRAAPWSASAYAARAEAYLALGELEEAAADARRAVDAEPRDAGHHLLAFRIEAERGNADAALAELRRARELSPRAASVRSPKVVELELELAGGR
jgi:hypothetical protein